MDEHPQHQIRAKFDQDTVRVYQAYSDEIADAALLGGRFVSPPFKLARMTWIKPSFLWMMYRSGWGLKDEGQRRILGIDITREGFEWALMHSCLSHQGTLSPAEWESLKARSPVRIQWDPERNLRLEPLAYRAIQIGLSDGAVQRYVEEWTVRIEDVTQMAHDIHRHVESGDMNLAFGLLPAEHEYPFDLQSTGWWPET